jgi:UDP-glucose 4-epimerase
MISLLDRHPLPVLPPWGTGLAAAAARRLGLALPEEMLNQLRFGRGLDNRLFKSTGFHYRRTSREAVLHLRDRLRLDPVMKGAASHNPYRYEPEVEEFLRRSPNVVRPETAKTRDAGLFDPSPPVED